MNVAYSVLTVQSLARPSRKAEVKNIVAKNILTIKISKNKSK